jgi:hypothetical protein
VRRLGVAAVVVLAALPATCRAQGISTTEIGFSTVGGNAWDVPVQVSGVVSVDFHGDRVAGCEQAGVCDVSGNETWDPGPAADLLAAGKRRPSGGILSFQGTTLEGGGTTTARVHRTAPDGSGHDCADAQTDAGGGELTPSGGALAVRLTSTAGTDPLIASSLLGTRCGGPVDDDVAGLLPAGRLTEAQLAAGHARVDLSTDRQFASQGFAGTLHSNVVLSFGAPMRQRSTGPAGRGSRRIKFVTVRYAIESVTGRASIGFAGLSEPELCDALDACGLAGRADLSLAATGGRLQLTSFGSGRLSRRQLMARAGLVRGRGKVVAFGEGAWSGGVSGGEQLVRSGALACREPLAPPVGALALDARGARLAAIYSPGAQSAGGGLGSRCPGSVPADLGDEAAVAAGRAPSSLLRRRRFALHLRRGASFSGQGYAGSSSADITVVLRRGRVSVTSLPVPGVPSADNALTDLVSAP